MTCGVFAHGIRYQCACILPATSTQKVIVILSSHEENCITEKNQRHLNIALKAKRKDDAF